jgi:ribosome-interacting GTPase 1
MPANLTAQYHKAEADYRAAQSPEEELECLQVMLREIPKHKGTDKLQADLKAKIAKLKADLATKKSSGGAKPGQRLPKQGAGRIVLVGGPNAGKSQLLASLTRAKPEIAPYPFTTQAPLPGMMFFEDCPMQLVDLPAVSREVFDSGTFNLVRSADLVLLVVGLGQETLCEDTLAVLERFQGSKSRLGRISQLDDEDIGTTYTQTLVVFNQSDAQGAGARRECFDDLVPLDLDCIELSAVVPESLDRLKEECFRRLDVVRVYSRNPKTKQTDFAKPFTIRKGETLVEVAEQIHRDFGAQLKGARIWGAGVHDGTMVKPDYQPQDKDVAELNIAGQ